MTRASTLLALLLVAPAAARADETEENFVYMPAPNSESLTVDQPLGRLTLNGWDSPEVRIHSVKRAPDGATLDKLKVSVEMRDGKIHVQTGVRVGGQFRSMPVQSAKIDLTIDAPRGAKVNATTWSGDLNASGFRAGAVLESLSSGEVRAREIQGKVVSHSHTGRQWLEAIHGDVEADGESGDVELAHIDGDVLEAKTVEGQIRARQVTTPVVRLQGGGIVLIGTLRSGGRYQLIALDGDVRLELKPAPFSVVAQASGRVASAFALRGKIAPSQVDAVYQGGGPSLVLRADRGDVLLQQQR
ncbi:MAG TPA: DUF4097 family beta strand repeat-containing protein [Polyangia bacterium]|nr:DUF4097 family beta strand repeat-containing protein [Polyangia bacterium]